MTRTPVRQRLILVGVVVITAIVGAAGLIIEMQRLASIDAFRTATLNLGNGMSQQTTQAIGLIDRALRDISADLMSTAGASVRDIGAAMRRSSTSGLLVDRYRPLAGVDSLSLVDADGRVVNTSYGPPPAGIDVSGSDFFGHFSSGGHHGVFVSAPIKDLAHGVWSAVMARRLDDSHGNFAGLVIAEISLTHLQEFYHLAMPARRSVYVLRRDGVILVRYPPRESEIARKVPDQSPWYAIVAQGGGTYHAPAYFDGTPVISAVKPLRDLPFVVEASVTEADTLSEWYQQRRWVVVGCISAIICVIALLRLFAAQYHRLELSELSLAAKNAELDTAHRQLDATLTNLSHGVCFYSPDQKLVVYNRRYCEIYDLPPEAIHPGMSLAEIAELRIAAGSFFSQTIDEYLASLDALVRAGKPHDASSRLRNGRTVSRHFQPLPGRGWVMTHEDITERCEAEAKIAFLARHDVLTGLANRALFQERLEHASAMAERGHRFAVLCLDLDRFKAVNDTWGHPVGDSLLRAVAARLRDVVRDTDTIARLGGDEFAVLQLNVSEGPETAALARRIVQTVHEPFEVEGHHVSVGTSVGIAMAPADGMNPVQLMKCADLALYRCKQEGRGAWRFFEPAMDAAATARRAVEFDLRSALSLGQLELHYQPFVASRDGELAGFEALLRWYHPTRGVVAPADFISVAEEIGIISEIGAWVLRQACGEAANWPGNVRVAVNLSPRQFRGRTLVSAVADAIQASGLPPQRLELEITESVPLQEDHATLSILHELRSLGARIALDDFGTGYSSLSYLRSFPFDRIKIDRSFVSDLQSSDKSLAIIRGIIGLASTLRMSVTAEGVETERQLEFLSGAGCTEIQGYLISKPVAAYEIPALIESLGGKAPLATSGLARVSG